MRIELNPHEARVIGCLIEKQITTPAQYPLSLSALTVACNQKSSRDPVMQLSDAEVQQAVDGLLKGTWSAIAVDSAVVRDQVPAPVRQRGLRQPGVHRAGTRDHLRAAAARDLRPPANCAHAATACASWQTRSRPRR